MKPNTIKDITDFIFLGKDFEELSHYDLLIINASPSPSTNKSKKSAIGSA